MEGGEGTAVAVRVGAGSVTGGEADAVGGGVGAAAATSLLGDAGGAGGSTWAGAAADARVVVDAVGCGARRKIASAAAIREQCDPRGDAREQRRPRASRWRARGRREGVGPKGARRGDRRAGGGRGTGGREVPGGLRGERGGGHAVDAEDVTDPLERLSAVRWPERQEGLRHLRDVGEPAPRVLLEAAGDRGLELRGDVGPELARRVEVALEDWRRPARASCRRGTGSAPPAARRG